MGFEEAKEYTGFLIPLVDSLGLSRHPLPKWSIDPIRELGEAHLAVLDVKALYRAEKALAATAADPSVHRPELRRLRAEGRRVNSGKKTARNLLMKMVTEHAARQAATVPSVGDLLKQVGR